MDDFRLESPWEVVSQVAIEKLDNFVRIKDEADSACCYILQLEQSRLVR